MMRPPQWVSEEFKKTLEPQRPRFPLKFNPWILVTIIVALLGIVLQIELLKWAALFVFMMVLAHSRSVTRLPYQPPQSIVPSPHSTPVNQWPNQPLGIPEFSMLPQENSPPNISAAPVGSPGFYFPSPATTPGSPQLYPTASPSSFHPEPYVSPYRSMFSTSPPLQQRPARTETIRLSLSDLSNAQRANQCYKSLGVAACIDRWTENTRMWLSSIILQPLVKHIQDIENHTGTPIYKPSIFFSEFGTGNRNSLFTTQPNLNTLQFSPNSPNNPSTDFYNSLSRARQVVDKYISVTGLTNDCREYVANRLKILAEGNYILNYNWSEVIVEQSSPHWYDSVQGQTDSPSQDDGHSMMEETLAKIRGSKSTSQSIDPNYKQEEPVSDALILMHLFCTFMDEKLNVVDPTKQEKPFTSRHYSSMPARPISVSSIIINLAQKQPPHFNLFVKDKTIELLRGQNNIFHAIALFVFHIKEMYNGFLHQLSLGSPNIQLLKILD